MTRRTPHDALLRRLTGPRRFLQVLAVPRQVGKTTLAQQVMALLLVPDEIQKVLGWSDVVKLLRKCSASRRTPGTR